MQNVTLKNGAVVNKEQMDDVLFKLRALMVQNQDGFHELVMKCRKPEHPLVPGPASDLRRRNLLRQNNTVDSDVRDIVLSGVTGEWPNLTLDTPVLDQSLDADLQVNLLRLRD
jgi:hypothetical protein